MRLIEEISPSGGPHDANNHMYEHALRDIVSPGDLIQFYVMSEPESPLRASTSREDSNLDDSNLDSVRLVLGAIPSSIDVMPLNLESTGEETLTEDSLLVQKGAFGALSESGIYLSMVENSKKGLKAFRKTRATETSTKLDIPHTSFVCIRHLYWKRLKRSSQDVSPSIATDEIGEHNSGPTQAITL